LFVDYADIRSCFFELFGNAAPYALGTACNDYRLILEIHH
jgi:hypothetical protein